MRRIIRRTQLERVLEQTAAPYLVISVNLSFEISLEPLEEHLLANPGKLADRAVDKYEERYLSS